MFVIMTVHFNFKYENVPPTVHRVVNVLNEFCCTIFTVKCLIYVRDFKHAAKFS